MVGAYFRFYYFYSLPPTQLSQYRSYLYPFIFEKYFPPIFRREHYMVLAIPFRV